jgi:hypothetical protein
MLEERAVPASPVIALDNLGNQGATLRGFEDSAVAGGSVAGAGDINGDGFADFIVGAPNTAAGGTFRGEAYVVFGGPSLGGTIPTLNSLGGNGFTLRGFEDNGFVGSSVSGAGDVNGDGFADIIVGASGGSGGRGEACVIFGSDRLAGATINLNELGIRGFTLRGFENNARAGASVAGAGDVNGDGFSDLIVGAPFTDVGGLDRGEAYVIFGAPTLAGQTVLLNNLGSRGFTLRGFESNTHAGASVAGAGDVNGDGFADVIIGAPFTNAGGTFRGEAYVVFGGSDRPGSTIILGALGDGLSITLRGVEDVALAGTSVAGAGDVNGDGFADVIVGAGSAKGGGAQRGQAFVVFGGSGLGGTTVMLNALGNGGFTLSGFQDGDFAGESVAGAGDVNGDGFGDLLVGAPDANGGGVRRGEAYIVFGAAHVPRSNVVLHDLGRNGITLRGFEDGLNSGVGIVAGAGDLNGDGLADVLLGAPLASSGGTERGEAFAVFAPVPIAHAVGSGPGVAARVNAYSKSGQVITSFLPYGSFVGGVRVAMGDVNGDGFPDIITAPGPGGGPHIRVFDGRSFNVIKEFLAYDAAFTGGVFVAAGDVNGDGLADIVTGAGAGGGPNVRVFNGATSGFTSMLANFFAYPPTFRGGVTVAAGDLNGDGRADIVTGAGPGGGPHVQVFDGTNILNVLKSFFAYDSSFTGGVSVGCGDVNGDSKPDIVTGAGAGGGPHVKVFSNAGALLQSFFAYVPGFTGGVAVAAEDIDGDGKAEIITGAGAGGGPNVRGFRASDRSLMRNFLAFDPGFTGGVFVG